MTHAYLAALISFRPGCEARGEPEPDLLPRRPPPLHLPPQLLLLRPRLPRAHRHRAVRVPPDCRQHSHGKHGRQAVKALHYISGTCSNLKSLHNENG